MTFPQQPQIRAIGPHAGHFRLITMHSNVAGGSKVSKNGRFENIITSWIQAVLNDPLLCMCRCIGALRHIFKLGG
jgi:hypothetical protein